MIDIVVSETGIATFDTQTQKAKNILSIQLGSLEYAAEFGVDLKYFLSDSFRVQNESFKSYLVQRLSAFGVNVASLIDLVDDLSHSYNFGLTPVETSTGLIAR